MDLAIFTDHLDRYGGEFAFWPSSTRADAEAFADRSAPARAALAATRELETFFRAGLPADIDRGDRIATNASRHRQVAPTRRFVARTGWGIAAAMTLFLGYALGGMATVQHEESPDRVMASALDMTSAIDVD